jgi:flagellar basal body rod protein FlgG
MNVSLFQASAAMNASSRWQEMISENLAASQVPGYKRQNAAFETFAAGAIPVQSTGATHYVMPRFNSTTDFTPAGLRSTGVDTDVAIDGAGFFAVQLPSGDVGYTRDGEFHRSPSGQLVTKNGYAVLGDGGPIQLDPGNPRLTISNTGEITQGTDPHGKIRIVAFNDPSKLTPTGGGYFTAQAPGLKSAEVPNISVRQGFLELANTNSVTEMTQLISSLRMFEMNQRVAQSQDERMGRTISELSPNS